MKVIVQFHVFWIYSIRFVLDLYYATFVTLISGSYLLVWCIYYVIDWSWPREVEIASLKHSFPLPLEPKLIHEKGDWTCVVGAYKHEPWGWILLIIMENFNSRVARSCMGKLMKLLLMVSPSQLTHLSESSMWFFLIILISSTWIYSFVQLF